MRYAILFHVVFKFISKKNGGGASSLARTLGIPCIANIRSNLEMVPLAAVELTISASGKRE